MRVGNSILRVAAVLCFWAAVTASRGMESEGMLTLVLGFMLLIATPQSATSVVGGLVAATVVVAGDRGLLDSDRTASIVVMVLGFLLFGFGDRIENWLKADRASR